MVASSLCELSDSDLDPHGNLDKVDKEEVATCHWKEEYKHQEELEMK